MAQNDRIVTLLSHVDALMPIRDVERQTGIAQATLRIWEKRYGFPRPLRDQFGDRVYPLHQVQRLHLVRQLLDKGMRPSKILSGNPALEHLVAQNNLGNAETLLRDSEPVFSMLRHMQLSQFRSHLQRSILALGLPRFVIDVLAPLTTAVGLGWQNGRLPVRCEHVYAEQVTALLHCAMSVITPDENGPKVVLATLTGEAHALGILMAETILASQGAQCIQLGASTPLAEVINTALETRADIVALSFSSYYSRMRLIQEAGTLRASLPASMAVWVGGEGAQNAVIPLQDISVMPSLAAIRDALSSWHRMRAMSES